MRKRGLGHYILGFDSLWGIKSTTHFSISLWFLCIQFDRWYLRMNIKSSTQYFFQIWHTTWRNTAIQLVSEHLHSAPKISHKYKGVVYIIVLRPFYTLIFSHSACKALSHSQLSRKCGILFHTYTKGLYHICFCSIHGLQFSFWQPDLQIAQEQSGNCYLELIKR